MRLGFSIAAIALALPAQALDRDLEETVSFTGAILFHGLGAP
jgi:hypothetical protein